MALGMANAMPNIDHLMKILPFGTAYADDFAAWCLRSGDHTQAEHDAAALLTIYQLSKDESPAAQSTVRADRRASHFQLVFNKLTAYVAAQDLDKWKEIRKRRNAERFLG